MKPPRVLKPNIFYIILFEAANLSKFNRVTSSCVCSKRQLPTSAVFCGAASGKQQALGPVYADNHVNDLFPSLVLHYPIGS